MARTINRLSHRKIETVKAGGMYADGGGLYLQVTEGSDDTVRKSWLFRFAINGRERQMGFGPLADVSLAEARDLASAAREMRRAGKDPIIERNAQRAQASSVTAKMDKTFDVVAREYIAAHRAGWRNVKHADQWQSTLDTYCSPVFGDLAVQLIDVTLIIKALEPIWASKPETANRVRGRIERILNYAQTAGYREGDNPARWKGHLENLLAPRSKVRRVKHHPALPYADLPAFMAELRCREGVAARALEFAILTAARTGEVMGARWNEIDLDGKVWTIPAERMKAGREHRVPLTNAAIHILKRMKELRQNDFVFYGDRRQTLSNMAFLMLLRRMKHKNITAHGFRSSFRDWTEEQTDTPRTVAEMALAHSIGSAVEAAYRRGDLFDKRRGLMVKWSDYCTRGERPDGNPAAAEQAAA